MKVSHWILGKGEVYGAVYERVDGNKIIFMYTADVNIEAGIEFRNNNGSLVVDNETIGILVEMFTKRYVSHES